MQRSIRPGRRSPRSCGRRSRSLGITSCDQPNGGGRRLRRPARARAHVQLPDPVRARSRARSPGPRGPRPAGRCRRGDLAQWRGHRARAASGRRARASTPASPASSARARALDRRTLSLRPRRRGPSDAAARPAQAPALAAIIAALGSGRGFLLHGVTASGKTEVYLRAAAETLARGEGVIVLVPEIVLTAQVVARFIARFGDRVALLHSALSAGERFDEWRRVLDGAADVVIGSRSALFAPLEQVGLVVVDEEQEPSYKQESAPRYHAVDAALALGRLAAATVVLGSATPRVTTYQAARSGQLALLPLPERIRQRPLPPATILDLRLH